MCNHILSLKEKLTLGLWSLSLVVVLDKKGKHMYIIKVNPRNKLIQSSSHR